MNVLIKNENKSSQEGLTSEEMPRYIDFNCSKKIQVSPKLRILSRLLPEYNFILKKKKKNNTFFYNPLQTDKHRCNFNTSLA